MQSCAALWRGALYTKPNVGDSRHFPAHSYHTEAGCSYYARQVPCPVPIIIPEQTKTDFFLLFRQDTIDLYCGNISDLEKPYDTFSITKSIISLLIGIAITDGSISSIDTPICNYLPGVDSSLQQITIRELLQMRSGIHNNFRLETILYYGTNLNWSIRQAKVREHDRGTFHYSNCSTQLLATILENTTHQSIQTYFHNRLWKPLEMEGNGGWSLDSKRHRTARAFCGLSLSPVNLLKIGKLILNHGKYAGRQIVSADWIKLIATAEIREPSYLDGYFYNYHWRCVDDGILFAKGLFGQFLYIDRRRNLLFLRMGRSEGKVDWIGIFCSLSERYV